MTRYLWPVLGLFFGLAAAAWAQTVLDPRPIAAVCAYNSTLPAVTTGTFAYVQCSSTGQLVLN